MGNSDQEHGRTKAGGKALEVMAALREVKVPELDNDIYTAGWVKNLSISGDHVQFSLALPEEFSLAYDELAAKAAQGVESLDWVNSVDVGEADYQPEQPVAPPSHAHGHGQAAARAPQQENLLPQVKHVITVGSGKGGVGKSTVSANLALALAAEGHKVGLLDADVYGPSIPLMLGMAGHPMITEEEKIIPMEAHGIKVMSMGFLLKPDQAVVWRGPMVHSAVRQFLTDVDWGDIDYLIIDLPPGTGDAPLSITQALPVTASVVVTTPQQVAAAVAQKAMTMFERLGIRIVGIIENMSYFICPKCNEGSDIFDRGGGRKLAEAAGVPFLGEIPIDMRMRQGGDVGMPVVVQFPDSELAAEFRKVARKLTEEG